MQAALDLARGEVRCPACAGGFLTVASPAEAAVGGAACGASYPVEDGVIDLLPGDVARRSVAQMVMEAEPIVRIYESRLWRRGPHVSLVLGISVEREQELILGVAELTGAETVLDLACGPGIYTRPFARALPAGTVLGLDLSLPMLRYANRRAREEAVDNILLIHGTALDLPFASNHFTAAGFRRSAGRVAALRAAVRRRLYGIDAFSSRELESQLRQAGLGTVQLHHDRAAWLIVSARKTNEEA
jgi:SAM-dependent methyltransferase